MLPIFSYEVMLRTGDGQSKVAILTPAETEDMPFDWWFAWPELLNISDSDCQGISKLSVDGQLWGLIRYGLYPYPGQPAFLEIEQVEANPLSRGLGVNRPVQPIGKWLIWYATHIALQQCQWSNNDTLVILTALASDFDYYRNKIQMKCLGPITIAPGEEGYVFRFTAEEAESFCRRQEEEWGRPHRL